MRAGRKQGGCRKVSLGANTVATRPASDLSRTYELSTSKTGVSLDEPATALREGTPVVTGADTPDFPVTKAGEYDEDYYNRCLCAWTRCPVHGP